MKHKKTKITSKSRVFSSMGQCASALGVNLDTLKGAKELGCPAFKSGGRIDEKEFLKWISANSAKLFSPSGTLSLRQEKIGEEIRKLRLRNDLEEGRLVKRADVAVTIQRIFGSLMPRLEQKLVTEYPSAICVDVIQGRIYGKRLYDQITEAFREFSKEWEQI